MVDNGDQNNMGSVRVRSRTKVRGPKSFVRVYDGAVALMLTLMSCYSILPATPFSHRIAVRNIGQVWSKLRCVRPARGAYRRTPAAGGDIQKKVMQRDERWTPPAYKAYTCNKINNYRRESRKLVMTTARKERPRGEEAYGGNKWKLVSGIRQQ